VTNVFKSSKLCIVRYFAGVYTPSTGASRHEVPVNPRFSTKARYHTAVSRRDADAARQWSVNGQHQAGAGGHPASRRRRLAQITDKNKGQSTDTLCVRTSAAAAAAARASHQQ